MAEEPTSSPYRVEMNAFWAGRPPGALQILCMLSAAAQGHRVRLFSYDRFDNIPGGIELADAREILPETEMYLHRATGSPAPFSDRFRYELIRKGFGAWMDADMLFLKPVPLGNGNIFAWEGKDISYVNNALILYDPKSALADELCEWSGMRDIILPWLSWPKRALLAFRRRFGKVTRVEDLPWGSTGPDLFTHVLRKHGMLGEASPWHRFYALPFDAKCLPMTAGGSPERYFTERTEAVHLWHQGLKGGVGTPPSADLKPVPFEKGSLLWRVAREVGMTGELVWHA